MDSQTHNEMDSVLRKAGHTRDLGHHFRTGLIPECFLFFAPVTSHFVIVVLI